MKKLLLCVSIIVCVLGLSACGQKEVSNQHQQQNLESAKQIAEMSVEILADVSSEEARKELTQYTYEELGYMVNQIYGQYGLNVDGYAFSKAMDSYASALGEIGAIEGIGETTATINDREIVVHVEVDGANKDAQAEFVFTNDMFLLMNSAALNPVSGMGELMKKAALNTFIGMFTVFTVLILISFIISGFALIPKIQDKLTKKPEQKVPASADGISHGVAQIVNSEEASEQTDDLELVAVIAAAIAASEGQTTTDGFVVRSIRKRACK